jgi:KDO2-lipid IV(A) lauroyltransferase
MSGVVANDASPDLRGDLRDLREGGTWTRAQRLKNGAIAVLVRAALALLVPLPRGILRMIGRLVGRVARVALARERRTAMSNVAIAFPDLGARDRCALVRRTYVTLGNHLGDALASLDPRRELDPLPIDDASLALLTRATFGVVFASAHLGPWERVAQSLVQHGVPLTALARETYDPRLSHVYDRLRASRGVHAIYRGHAGAASRILRTLRAGGVLGIPMDLRSRVPSIDAPFLGRLAPTPVGPARIALRTGAAVVVGSVAPTRDAPACESNNRALRITCTAIRTDDLTTDEQSERVLTARINAELTVRILALPVEWVWMHDRFGDWIPVS